MPSLTVGASANNLHVLVWGGRVPQLYVRRTLRDSTPQFDALVLNTVIATDLCP